MNEYGNISSEQWNNVGETHHRLNMIKGVVDRNTAIKKLNEFQNYSVPKIRTLKDFELIDFNSPIEFNPSSDTSIVYTVWNDYHYLKFLHLSLKSLNYFTDLKDINIRIVLDEKLFTLGVSLFDGILPYECFIKYNRPLTYKYNLVNLPELSDFEHI